MIFSYTCQKRLSKVVDKITCFPGLFPRTHPRAKEKCPDLRGCRSKDPWIENVRVRYNFECFHLDVVKDSMEETLGHIEVELDGRFSSLRTMETNLGTLHIFLGLIYLTSTSERYITFT